MKHFRLKGVAPALLTGLLIAVCCGALRADSAARPASKEGDPYADETAAQRDARMAWWREAKFGMFIHWGVYAVPGGLYDGKPVSGIGEWILRNAKIPQAQYRAYAKDFTAEHYDPKAWAALAKQAGMRYMVITSKHHDGFALFPSKVSQWNALEAAASKRDLIDPLAKAARAEGLKFGLYYSQSQDWIHPGGAIYGYKEGEVFNPEHKGSYDEYLKNIAVPQVREILTTYQPDVLWWDTPLHMSPERAKPLIELLKLRPGIIHNNRLGGGYHGDTETPEQFIPATGFPGRDWETCMTMNDTWGFKKNDLAWKSSAVLISNLINAVSKGGNYLLNVGPDPQGRIPDESVRLLGEVGAWMKVNGESIYGTQASPFACRLPWGRCTMKQDGANGVLYLHVGEWPRNGMVVLPGLQNKILKAQLLAGGRELKVLDGASGPQVDLTGVEPLVPSTTVVVRLEGPAKVVKVPVIEDPDGVIRLTPLDAELKGALKLGQRGGFDVITNWNEPAGGASWDLIAPVDGNYLVRLLTSCDKKGAVIMLHGVGKHACQVPQSANNRTFVTSKVGETKLKKGQKLSLRLEAVADGWQPVNVASVELVPQN